MARKWGEEMPRDELATIIKKRFNSDFDLLSDAQLGIIAQEIIECHECPIECTHHPLCFEQWINALEGRERMKEGFANDEP